MSLAAMHKTRQRQLADSNDVKNAHLINDIRLLADMTLREGDW